MTSRPVGEKGGKVRARKTRLMMSCPGEGRDVDHREGGAEMTDVTMSRLWMGGGGATAAAVEGGALLREGFPATLRPSRVGARRLAGYHYCCGKRRTEGTPTRRRCCRAGCGGRRSGSAGRPASAPRRDRPTPPAAQLLLLRLHSLLPCLCPFLLALLLRRRGGRSTALAGSVRPIGPRSSHPS